MGKTKTIKLSMEIELVVSEQKLAELNNPDVRENQRTSLEEFALRNCFRNNARKLINVSFTPKENELEYVPYLERDKNHIVK